MQDEGDKGDKRLRRRTGETRGREVSPQQLCSPTHILTPSSGQLRAS